MGTCLWFRHHIFNGGSLKSGAERLNWDGWDAGNVWDEANPSHPSVPFQKSQFRHFFYCD